MLEKEKEMTDITKELLFGMRPVRRTNPQPGESEWYYLDPRGADTFDSMKHIDVASETSPNPYAGEIQNYLYKNDLYNYKQLYGNTPPPALNQPTLTPIDNTNSYTTESTWGYPNNTQSPYYQQMGEPYNMNQNSLSGTASPLQPYIFSEDMRNRLGQIESGNKYDAHNLDGGGFGALGKYQIRRDGFVDMGYLDNNYNWTGKNGIYSLNDFLTSPEKQEQALDEYLKSNYGQLKNKGALNYLGTPMQGIVNNFDITNTGLLAASHREGAGAVNNYLKHLVKNQNERYYIDYNNISDRNMSEMFKRIETRLRNFEK